MSLKRFVGLVKSAAPPYLKDQAHLRAAIIDVAEKRDSLDAKLVPEIVDHAEGLYRQNIRLTHTASGSIASEFLVGKLAPVVEALREEKFPAATAPFDSVEKAAVWIEQTSEADLQNWRKTAEQRQKAEKEIERLASEHSIEIAFKTTLLAYQRPNEDHVKHVPVVPSTYLYRLAKETKRIAKFTGLPEDAFTMHILTGLRPQLSQVRSKHQESRFTLPDGEQLLSRWVDVRFFARDLREEDLRKVYSAIRDGLGVAGKRPFKDEDLHFLQFIEDIGPIPEKGKMEFWEDALSHWRRLYPETKITTRDGMKRKFERLDKRRNTSS